MRFTHSRRKTWTLWIGKFLIGGFVFFVPTTIAAYVWWWFDDTE